MARMRINSPLYNSTAELPAFIDAVALVLTNGSDYLHELPHSTP
jgi:hypothetical protein